MGWSFGDETRDECVKNAIGSTVKVVARADKPGVTWLVLEGTPESEAKGFDKAGVRTILALLVAKDRKMGWGYKDVTESMGPAEESCPLEFLDMVPDPGGYATAWRARVRTGGDRRKALAKALRVGATFTAPAGWSAKRAAALDGAALTIASLRPLIATDADGNRYRIPRRMAAEALLPATAA